MSPDQYAAVKKVMDSKGIPEFVWYPIMMMESGGNPDSHANTSLEDSRGLFQINVKAHPQWKDVNLYDPVENATLAADYFLSPALYQAGANGLTKEGDITAYVWKNGIRPAWTEAKNQSIREKVADFLKNGSTSSGGNTAGGAGGATTPVQDAVSKITGWDVWDKLTGVAWNLVPFIVGLLLLVLVFYSMFLKGNIIIEKTGGE